MMPSHKNQIKMLALLSHKYNTDNIDILTFQASQEGLSAVPPIQFSPQNYYLCFY